MFLLECNKYDIRKSKLSKLSRLLLDLIECTQCGVTNMIVESYMKDGIFSYSYLQEN